MTEQERSAKQLAFVKSVVKKRKPKIEYNKYGKQIHREQYKNTLENIIKRNKKE